MKPLLRLKLYLILIVFLASQESQCGDVFAVSEVTRVLSPVSFECRLKNYPDTEQVRFRVILKGAAPSTERSEAESIEALRRILTSAENIELRQANVRNYFRIEAEVWVQSQSIKPELLAGKFIRETKLDNTALNPETAEPRMAKNEAPLKRGKAEAARPEIVVGASTLQSLLKARIDASSLRAETPLIEALELISGSLDPRLPVVVFWSDLQNNAFIDRDTPIGVDGFGVMPAAQALDIVLYSVSGSGMPLKFTIDGGVLKIGTLRSLSGKVTRVYSITDLLLPRANFDEEYGSGAGAAGGMGGRY
jgi:hypothetical protein